MPVDFTFELKKRFTVNGKEYSSIEEMPENIRDAYEQALQESSAPARETTITVNGRELKGLESLPPIARAIVKILGRKSLPGGIAGTAPAAVHTGRTTAATREQNSYNPLVRDGSGSPFALFFFIVAFIVILISAICYFQS